VTEAKQSQKQRPAVFIGSSTEGLRVAKTIQVLLDQSCEVSVWSQGVFGLGEGSLESLVKNLDSFDFAILVLTPDDLVEKRGDVKQAPRDNVLLELGLFIGALGRDRSFAVYDRKVKLHLPTDLAGVTMATYTLHESGNLRSSLGAASTLIEDVVYRLGRRNKFYSPYSTQIDSSQKEEIEALKNQVGEMSKMLRQLVNNMKPVDILNQDSITNELGLESFTGKWLATESNSYFYPEIIGNSLVVPYCYGGNDEATSVFYDWAKTGEFLFARFVWFSGDISGFAFFRPISKDRIEGWWWSSFETNEGSLTQPIPDISSLTGGVSMSLKRLDDSNMPMWALEFHKAVLKIGSIQKIIRMYQKKARNW
jgi:hypothetical protein